MGWGQSMGLVRLSCARARKRYDGGGGKGGVGVRARAEGMVWGWEVVRFWAKQQGGGGCDWG